MTEDFKITLLILVLVLLVGAAGYWWVNHQVDRVTEVMEEPIPPVGRAFE